jgi:hypothetical protein
MISLIYCLWKLYILICSSWFQFLIQDVEKSKFSSKFMCENFVFLITFLQLDRIKGRATTLLQKQNSFLTMDGMWM